MSDYQRIAQAIKYLVAHTEQQPTLEQTAAHLHLSPYHFQRLFCRWTGVSPKKYLQILTLERAKQLLTSSRPLLDIADTLGLSSGSRLYDHFVKLEAMTPGEFRAGGAGLRIDYGIHDSPFGDIFIAITQRGICKLCFIDGNGSSGALTDLQQRWPHAEVQQSQHNTGVLVDSMFALDKPADRPLSLLVSGTNFQVNVWKALLQIPPGTVTCYSRIATAIGHENSARAVGTAIGANQIALLIPCHRVIQSSGKIAGYHWGETRKHAIHAWEAARHDS